MKKLLLLLLICYQSLAQNPYILVLGIAQDGGYPQAGCTKECCKAVYEKKLLRQAVSCIALIDPISNEKWIFDATPDFGEQLAVLNAHNTIIGKKPTLLDGIFLTHAHIGHYIGLMHLGREVIGAKSIKVFAMPKMKTFLETNGPWSQLVNLQNIAIQPINEDTEIYLNERLKIVPFRVPHRDEFSETVGFQIISKNKKMIFIPDIDKWQRWKQDLKTVIENNDILLLDGTFYKDGEINRPMSEVPHPFVVETMDLLKNIPIKSKNKVHFIHINHTNPILNSISKEYQEVILNGFGVCQIGQVFNF